MKEHPILMKSFLIEAIRNTKLNTWPPEPIDSAKAFKGMTRRMKGLKEINGKDGLENWLVKRSEEMVEYHDFYHTTFDVNYLIKCPYGQPGDLLWVKESILKERQFENPNNPAFGKTIYCGDLKPGEFEKGTSLYFCNDKLSPLFMPKAAARIWLQIVEVKVERLQDINSSEAVWEGVEPEGHLPFNTTFYKNYLKDFIFEGSPINSFSSLIDSINGPGTWQQNPWVWVISFKVISTTGRPDISPEKLEKHG